jgi:hypothetical protein
MNICEKGDDFNENTKFFRKKFRQRRVKTAKKWKNYFKLFLRKVLYYLFGSLNSRMKCFYYNLINLSLEVLRSILFEND